MIHIDLEAYDAMMADRDRWKAARANAIAEIDQLKTALEDVLPQHMALCVAQPNPQTDPWTFDSDENGHPLITQESCQCSPRIKEIRALIPPGYPKGFAQNPPAPATRHQ